MSSLIFGATSRIARFFLPAVVLSFTIVTAVSAYPLPSSSQEQRVVFGTFEAPPLASIDQRGKLTGYLGHYLRALEGHSNLRFEVRHYASLGELKQAINHGEVHVAGPLAPTRNPILNATFTRPIERLPVAIVSGSSQRPETVVADDLAGKRVAVLQAGVTDDYLQRFSEVPQYIGMETDIDVLEAVSSGYTEFALLEQSRVEHVIERRKLSNLKVVGHLPFPYEPRLAVAYDRPEVLLAVERAIDSIRIAKRESLRQAWRDSVETPWYRTPQWMIASLAAFLVLGTGAAAGREARKRERKLRQTTDELLYSERIYRALEGGVSDMVTLHAPEGTILYASPSVQVLTGYAADELLTRGLAQFVHPEDASCVALQGSNGLEEDMPLRGTIRLLCKSGEYRSFEYTAQAFAAGKKGEYVVVSRDVTERLALEAGLERAHTEYRHLAYHDSRTNLPNREAVLLQLRETIADAAKNKKEFSVLLLDVDNFKAINNTFGDAAGDELLTVVVSRLKAVAGSYWLGRAGGDAFLAIVPYVGMTNISALAGDIVASNARPATISGEDAYVTVSVGVARYPVDGTDSKRVLTAAEIALGAAKKAGKNTWRCHDEALGRLAAMRGRSLQNLRRVIERGDLLLHYQPKVSLATGRLTGYEALLRWRSPIGLESADELVATAEQCGFIGTLDEWVIRTAAQQSLAWKRSGYRAPIAVNLSGLRLQQPRFIDTLGALVQADPQLPNYLLFEVTESVLSEDLGKTLDCLRKLGAMGFQIHIDDFGTGYSSLSRLSRLPVTALKIERSLIEGTPCKPEACAVVKGIIALARALRLTVIAVGVTTQEQADFLHEDECEEAQGYYAGRPEAAGDIEAGT